MATTTPTLTRYRGDTVPDQFILTDAAGAVLDITTGYSFKLTVDPENEPVDATNNLFSLSGVVTDGPTGAFEFRPNALQANQTPGTYYYDVQVTDPGGFVKTIEKGKYVFKQDITKT